MELLVLLGFCALLLASLLFHWPLLLALLGGMVLFLIYGARKGFSGRALAAMSWKGAKTSGNVLLMLVLIGAMTALWRASGTLPTLITYASGLIWPGVMVLVTFLLNALMSFLTGTSFGTAATMGLICVSIGRTMGISPVWLGGAMLSGAFFGDRCSPVSTSALLNASVTKTDHFHNLRLMMRSALVPLIMAAAIFAVVGIGAGSGGAVPDIRGLFSVEFRLHLVCLIPAVLVLVLSVLRINVHYVLLAGLGSAFVIAAALQHRDILFLLRTMLTGYVSANPEVAALMDGGGIVSMLSVIGIVCITACYAGIFEETGLLDFLKDKIVRIAGKVCPFNAVLLTSVIVAVISCNQTLPIMLTPQLCSKLKLPPEEMMLDVADTAVVVSPLIPWSVAGATPLATAGAPTLSVIAACYLYLIPLWRGVVSYLRFRRGRRTAAAAAENGGNE